MSKIIAALLSVFIIAQPVVGHANALGFDGHIDKKTMLVKARQKRAEHTEKQKLVQQQRSSGKVKSAVSLSSQDEPCDSGCCGCTVISPSDFGVDQDTTYVITTPGRYTLQQDVTFNPPDLFTPAINILCDNVTLDLCSHTLSQGDDTPFCYGVQIGEGYFYNDPDFVLKNIEVTNGNIINFTSCGIFCYNGSFDDPSLQVAFEDLRFLGLNVLHCGSMPSIDFGSGINLDSFADSEFSQDINIPVAFKNITIKECNVNECLGSAAINVYTQENLVIADTQANDLVNIEAFAGTFAYNIYGKNIVLTNCQGNGTRQVDLSTDQCGGLNCEDSVNVYVRDSQFNNAFGQAAFIVNTNLSNDHNLVMENCQFNNSQGGEQAGLVAGIHMSDGAFQTRAANGMKFINCQFNGTTVVQENEGENFIAGFIAITLRDIIFENCEACNIHTDSPTLGVYGFWLPTEPADPAYPFANNYNISFVGCTASDLSGNSECVGIGVPVGNNNQTPFQGLQTNMVVENCIVERIYSTSATATVAGIGEYLVYGYGNNTQFPAMKNLFVKGCRVSDVHSNYGGCPSKRSAGIFVESVQNPVVENNSVSDCDSGIVFSGTKEIIPNCFQLAYTKEDALAFPPQPIDTDAGLFVITDEPGLGPFPAVLMQYSPPLTAAVSGLGKVAVDATAPINNACEALTNDLTGDVGVCRRGDCNFVDKTTNIEAAGGIATIVVQNTLDPPFDGSGVPTGTGPSVMIGLIDGNALIAALDSNPNITLTIDAIPSVTASYEFTNEVTGDVITIVGADIDGTHEFLCPGSANLTELNWMPGDAIYYTIDSGDPIPGLTPDQTYYAIVYRPGFTRRGLVQNNNVTNCLVSGYRDDRHPTKSAWINNMALLNGKNPSHTKNFAIKWPNKKPQVDEGTLGEYPKCPNKNFNTSLVYAKKRHKSHHHSHH